MSSSPPSSTPRISVDDFGGLHKLLVETVRDYAIFALDPTGRILTWNAGARRLKGYEPSEIIGQHFSKFYPHEDIVADKPAWELRVAAAEGRFEDEGWRVRKDGTLFWANVVITALNDPSGTLVGFAKVTRDLTERRAAQNREVADARRIAAAEVANEAKSAFLAAMSHELRTPLNAIAGYVDLLEVGTSGQVNEQQLKYLRRIRSSQQHLLVIINDLLNFSKIEAGQMAYDLRDFAIHTMVDDVLPLVEPQARAKGLTTDRGPCESTLIAHADRTKVEQVVLNLLSNAVKFTQPGGHIHVECTRSSDGAWCVVSVNDTGPGIPDDKHTAIFEPFVQLGRSLTRPHEGTGLGLAISRDLALGMGGDLTVESVVGKGSTFTLTLPVATHAAN
jgi:PAS domain S-box-containing protein